MVEHGPGEEEGDVRVDVELGQQLLNRGQPRSVIILEKNKFICILNLLYPIFIANLRHVRGQECPELDECVVTLIKEFPHQLQMVRFSFLGLEIQVWKRKGDIRSGTWYTTQFPCCAISSTRGTASSFSRRQSFSL